MTDQSTKSEAVQRQIETYANWVRDLRGGAPVASLVPEHNDPLARLGHELQLLADSLSRREQELQQLFGLMQGVEQGMSLEDVLHGIFDGFAGIIPYDRISCALMSEDGDTISAHWVRSNLGEIHVARGYAQPLAGSGLQEIVRTGEPRILNDLEAYLDLKPQSDATRRIVREGGRSSLTCPLLVGERPVGFLFFTSRHKNTYQQAHQATFSQIARQVSIVIDKSRLYHRIVERTRHLMRERKRLEEAAARDALTGVLNRGAIMGVLERALQEAEGAGHTAGVVLADIDHFKQVNDRWGHAAGDEALKEFTGRLAAVLRQGDHLGRYGGEEFLIVIANATGESVQRMAERLRVAVADRPFQFGGETHALTASFGAAVARGKENARDVLLAADRALYAAKRAGRNRVVTD